MANLLTPPRRNLSRHLVRAAFAVFLAMGTGAPAVAQNSPTVLNLKPGSHVTDVTGSGDYEILQFLGSGAGGDVWKIKKTDPSGSGIFSLKILNGTRESRRAYLQVYPDLSPRLETSGENSVVIYRPVQIQTGPASAKFNALIYPFAEDILHERLTDISTRAELLGQADDLTIRLTRITAVVKDGLAGLSEMARVGYVHSDIRPENIYMTGKLEAIDQGTAHFVLGDEDFALPPGNDVQGGTPPYAAPEMMSRFFYSYGGHVTYYSDLFMLGSTLYELVFGLPPYLHYTLGKIIPEKELTDSMIESSNRWALKASGDAKEYQSLLTFVTKQFESFREAHKDQLNADSLKKLAFIQDVIESSLQYKEGDRFKMLLERQPDLPLVKTYSDLSPLKFEKQTFEERMKSLQDLGVCAVRLGPQL